MGRMGCGDGRLSEEIFFEVLKEGHGEGWV